jgi:parallel beta-helix repeat protein
MPRRSHLGFGLALVLVLGSLVVGSQSASANSSTLWVNAANGPWFPPGTSCDDPGFQTIQAAVTAAAPGDRINVCPGTYTEEVTIPAGKDNISLRSVRAWQAAIKAPAVMLGLTKSIVRVNGAHNVTILAFTITGPGGGGCDSLQYGVRVDSAGSANILGNHITQIRDTPFSGCQNGVAVQVGRAAETTTGSAKVIGNVIDNYQKNGPTVSNTGSNAEIAYNRILGAGPTAVIAQNGIQVSSGATGTVRHNFVSGGIYTPQTVVSTGILVFNSGMVVVDHNTVTSNDVGIYLLGAAAGSVTSDDQVRASTFDGVTLDVTNSNQVVENRVEDNGGPGISMYDGSQQNTIADNKVEDNSDSGILLDNASSNTISENKVRENGSTTNGPDTTDGIRVNSPSTSNTIQDNHLRDNVTHDCHDNSTGNTWTENQGETSQPPSLCGRDNDDSHFQDSTTYGWDASAPWYLGFDGAADYDWATTYAAVDTNALLQLLPQVQVRLHGAADPQQ